MRFFVISEHLASGGGGCGGEEGFTSYENPVETTSVSCVLDALMRKEYLLDGYSITLEIMATSPQANLRMPLGVASVVFTILFTTRANGERRSHGKCAL